MQLYGSNQNPGLVFAVALLVLETTVSYEISPTLTVQGKNRLLTKHTRKV